MPPKSPLPEFKRPSQMALNPVGKLPHPPSQIQDQHVFVAGSQVILPGDADPPIPALLSQTVQSTQAIPQTSVHEVTDEELFIEQNLFCSSGEHSATVVKERLHSNLKFWRNIGASAWVTDIIRDGYCLPFVERPARKFFNNHSSCDNHVDYVSKELKKLVSTGAIVEVNKSELAVCSPLGVVSNSPSLLLRLILPILVQLATRDSLEPTILFY